MPETLKKPLDTDAEPVTPAKRARVEKPYAADEESVKDCFTPSLFDESNVAKLAEAYKTAMPYKHGCLPALVEPKLLRQVRTEIEQNLVFTQKETDIYKVLQTGDLANIDGLSSDEKSSLGSLHKLRDAIYSKTFRDFISQVSGCGALSGTKHDMSVNSYCQGSHLLCHDDVIGTRRVSFILYMPDPQDWDPKFGGALELYPCVAKETPDVAPTASVPPRWNQFAFFQVIPGYSFHSVQEVVAPHDRLSIQGWFHIPQPGEPEYVAEDVEMKEVSTTGRAQLAQLEEDTRDVEYPFQHVNKPTSDTTDADREYLAKFLSADYLSNTNLEQVNERFAEDSSIQLVNFLNKDYADLLLPLLKQADARDGLAEGKSTMTHGTGVHPGWKVQGSPVKQRFMVLSGDVEANEPSEVSKLRELQDLFKSEAFHRWIFQAAGLACVQHRGRARRFRPGLDYTLGTLSNVTSVLDVTLSVTPADECWEEGERGGYECYVASDEQNDDPAIYRAAGNDDDTLLATQAGWNVLTVVLRDQGVMRFVKYVSALANGSRWDVSYEYLTAEE